MAGGRLAISGEISRVSHSLFLALRVVLWKDSVMWKGENGGEFE